MKKGIVKTIFSIPELTLLDWQELFRKHPKGGDVAASTVSGWKNGKQSMSLYYRNSFLRILCDTPVIQNYWKEIQFAVVEYLGIKKKFKVYNQLLEADFEEFARLVLNQLTAEKAESIRLVGEVVSATNVLQLFGDKVEELRQQFDFDKEKHSDKLVMTYHFEDGDYKVAVGFFFGEIPEATMEVRCHHFYENSEGCQARFIFLTLGAPENLCARMTDEYGILLTKISAEDREESVPAAEVFADSALGKFKEVLAMVKMCGNIGYEETENRKKWKCYGLWSGDTI